MTGAPPPTHHSRPSPYAHNLRFMNLLVQHMSANGDHLSAESFEWSVVCSERLILTFCLRALAVTSTLPPPRLQPWVWKYRSTRPPLLLPKPKRSVKPKTNRSRLPRQETLRQITKSVVRNYGSLVRFKSVKRTMRRHVILHSHVSNSAILCCGRCGFPPTSEFEFMGTNVRA